MNPRLFPETLRMYQVNHFFESQSNSHDGLGPQIGQRKFVVSKMGVAFAEGRILGQRKIDGWKCPGCRPASSKFEAAFSIKEFDDANKFQMRSAKGDAVPFGKTALRPS